MFFVDLKETKVNLVTAAVFAALPTGSVQSTHLTQTVVFYLNLNANTNTNTNVNTNTNTNTPAFSQENAFFLHIRFPPSPCQDVSLLSTT